MTLWLLFILSIYGLSIDSPVQLIYPDDVHQNLFLNETAMKIIRDIKIPIAVVGVVGPFHSGKSYLTNQLLGRTEGFQIGPTVDPQTRGLWIWGKPVIRNVNGVEVAVLFIDSEGLFSSNMTESYDAKIFAISSLLSSLLIYNTIHNIDQSYIDYIEILSRRAQLFSMKMELKNADKGVELMKFPPLIWVIQDFHLQMNDGLTPTDWLQSLLRSPNREGKTSGIPTIFESITCKPLYYPVGNDPLKFRHLDRVPYNELTDEYKTEIQELRDLVFNNSNVKKRGEITMNGPLLALLLESLVDGANKGEFPSVPSVWDSFIRLASSDAQQKSLSFIEKRYNKEFESNIFSDQELENKLVEMESVLHTTFKSLMLGVEVDEKRFDSLTRALKNIQDRYSELNKRRLDSQAKQTMERLNKVDINNYKLPMISADLEDQISFEIQQALENYTEKLSSYRDSERFKYYQTMLTSTLKSEYEKLKQLNREKLFQKFDNAMYIAREKFIDFIREKTVAMTPGELEELFNKGKAIGLEHYRKESIINEKEGTQEQDKFYVSEYERYQILLVRALKEIFDKVRAKNEETIYNLLTTGSLEIKKRLRESLDAISLPQVRAIIEDEISINCAAARSEFKNKFSKYESSASYQKALTDLEKSFQSEVDHLHGQNEKQMYLFTNALGHSKTQLLDDVKHYYLDWSFKKHAYEMITKDLENVIKDPNLAKQTAELIVYQTGASKKSSEFEEILPPKFLISIQHIAVAVGLIVIAVTYLVFKK